MKYFKTSTYQTILLIMYCLILLFVITADILLIRGSINSDEYDFINIQLSDECSNQDEVIQAIEDFIDYGNDENALLIHETDGIAYKDFTIPMYLVRVLNEEVFFNVDNISARASYGTDFKDMVFYSGNKYDCFNLDENGCYVSIEGKKIYIDCESRQMFHIDQSLYLFLPYSKYYNELNSFSSISIKLHRILSNSERKQLLDSIDSVCKIENFQMNSESYNSSRELRLLYFILYLSCLVILTMTFAISNRILLHSIKLERIKYILGQSKFKVWLDCFIELGKIVVLSDIIVGLILILVMNLSVFNKTFVYSYRCGISCLVIFSALTFLINSLSTFYFCIRLFRRPATCLYD